MFKKLNYKLNNMIGIYVFINITFHKISVL